MRDGSERRVRSYLNVYEWKTLIKTAPKFVCLLIKYTSISMKFLMNEMNLPILNIKISFVHNDLHILLILPMSNIEI